MTMPCSRRLPSLLLFCLIPLLISAPVSALTLADKVSETSLENGLKVLLVDRPGSPTVAAYLTIGVGSVHETSTTRGVAHLLEHMLFKGTQTLGTTDYAAEKPLLDQIEAVGSRIDALKHDPDKSAELAQLRARLAELQQQHRQYVVKDEFSSIYAANGGVGYNAFTSKDLTTYLISLPNNKLELWALIESDRMKNAVLREFYTERDVIHEERRRSYESSPGGLLYETLLASSYEMHPYREPVIGWHSDIENLTLAETRDFHQRYYAPINTVITLVGDFDQAQVLALIERYFGSIPPGTPVPLVTDREPPQAGERRVFIEFDAEPALAIAWHKPTLPDRADYVFDLLDLVLSGGRTSRLYQALVVEQQLATSVSTYGAPGSRYANLFVISATPRHPHTAGEVEAAIYRELQRLLDEPVTGAELEQALNRLRTDHLRSMQSNGGLARTLSYYQTVAGDWHYLTDYDAVVSTIRPEELTELVRSFLTARNRTVVTLGRSEEVQP
jgi:predicted Zn-dependent peptidase